jgi:predicted acyl esterase
MKMTRYAVLLLLIFASLCSTATGQAPTQDIAGSWKGAFIFGQGKVRSILYIGPRSEGGYTGSLIGLDSGNAFDTGPITFSAGKLTFDSKSIGMKFEGVVSPSGNELKGKFTAGETSGTVTLTREPSSSTALADQYTSQEQMIPMRDGVRLHTIVFSPKNRTGALPFLIERSPYGWDDASAYLNFALAELAKEGYFFVFQDIRGRYKSEGQFVMQRPVRVSSGSASKEVDEGTDTYDTIEWLLKNVPGNNGRAGIMGISYGGWLTEMALIEPHPALKATSEQASPADMFLGDDFDHNGAFRLSYGFEYAAMMETGNTNKPFQFSQYDTYDWYLKLGPISEANARVFQGQRPTWNNFIAIRTTTSSGRDWQCRESSAR